MAASAWFGCAILLASLLLLQGCGEEPPVKEVAADFTLPLFSGGEFKLARHKGEPVVVNFFASWCIPCKEEIPWFNNVYLIYKPEGVAFVGIAVDDTEEKARKFAEEVGIVFPSGIDKSGEIKEAYGVYGVPTTFFIDRDGTVSYIHPGGVTEELLRHELDKML